MSKPVILDYAISRKGSEEKIYSYDYEKDMNVLNEDNKILFIETPQILSEIVTITHVEGEQDDEDMDYSELVTKTAASRERDDEEFSLLDLANNIPADK